MLTADQWYQVLLKLTQCRGAEGEENPPPKDDEEFEDEEDAEEQQGEEGKKKGDEEDTGNLVKTLKKERADRKRFERELKQLRAQQQEREQGETGEAEKARRQAQAAQAKVEKLAGRLANQAVDMAIAKAATKFKFRDVGDALVQVTRDLETWVDQDPDDPSVIEVDEEAVEKAVKKLADSKKYLLDAGGEGEPSGSKFGGRKNDDGSMSEEALRAKYSALNR